MNLEGLMFDEHSQAHFAGYCGRPGGDVNKQVDSDATRHRNGCRGGADRHGGRPVSMRGLVAMRYRVIAGMFSGGVLLCVAALTMADTLNGSGKLGGVGVDSTESSSKHAGSGSCSSELSSDAEPGDSVYQDAPFVIAPVAGATNRGLDANSSGEFTEKLLSQTTKTVSVNLAKKVDGIYVKDKDKDKDNVVGAYAGSCHDQKAKTDQHEVPEGESRSLLGSVTFEDDTGTPIVVEFASTVEKLAGVVTFSYSIAQDSLDHDFIVTWPSVRTPDYPNGWTTNVAAAGQATYSYQATSDEYAQLLGGAAVVELDNVDRDEVARSACPTYVPWSNVTLPSDVAQLSGVYSPTTHSVTLTWQNTGAWDGIQVFRVSAVGEPVSWLIDGSSTAFIDDVPVSGSAEYFVHPIEAGFGPVLDTATIVTVP